MTKDLPLPLRNARPRLSRRHFIRLIAVTGAGLAVAGCQPAPPLPPPAATGTTAQASLAATPLPTMPVPNTATAVPATATLSTATALPSATPVPAATLRPPTAAPTVAPTATTSSLADLMKIYPAAPSAVVRTQHAGAWNGDKQDPAVMRQMLDASITRLTGLNDAREAWAALFKPGERIAIKVNTISGSSVWTNVPLVNAVVDSLVAAGIAARQIVIFDRTAYELKDAGFVVNQDGPGAQCVATGSNYGGSYKVGGVTQRLSQVLTGCDALINMPVLKQHSYSGVTFSMKNHYGTVDNPGGLHASATLNVALPDLNNLPEIRQRTRLIIGDCMLYTKQDSWNSVLKGDTLLMSFDTVAIDAMALQKLLDLKKAAGENTTAQTARATPWLSNAAKLGLGTNDQNNMRLVEVKLG